MKIVLNSKIKVKKEQKEKKRKNMFSVHKPPGRIELPTPGLQDQCSNRWAMEAYCTERAEIVIENFRFYYIIQNS